MQDICSCRRHGLPFCLGWNSFRRLSRRILPQVLRKPDSPPCNPATSQRILSSAGQKRPQVTQNDVTGSHLLCKRRGRWPAPFHRLVRRWIPLASIEMTWSHEGPLLLNLNEAGARLQIRSSLLPCQQNSGAQLRQTRLAIRRFQYRRLRSRIPSVQTNGPSLLPQRGGLHHHWLRGSYLIAQYLQA